jgi:mannose-6-phosphate isomerase-like protein (cupin superfamily)
LNIDLNTKIVRYGELIPCKTAFIDAHTPGSDQKENFTIIGDGVAESPDQHVHLNDTPGFNIGAAGQPPGCTNSLHFHHTAEVFFILKGRWRFFWGRRGDAGEVVLDEGDIINIPTHIFRGFENVGTDYGMIMAVLGGNDAGGGVVWAPEVLDTANKHGLVLDETGKLYDTKKGEQLPEGVKPMQSLSETELTAIGEPPVQAIVRDHVARYWDMMALSRTAPCDVIGEQALLQDLPGFDIDFLSRDSISAEQYCVDSNEIIMIMRGHWRLEWSGGHTVLNPGDTCAVPPGQLHSLSPAVSGEASLFRVRNTHDLAGATKTQLLKETS